MNSCVLMAKVVRTPELRYTQDSQKPFTQMLVEFEPLRSDEAPATLKVIGWGNLASDIAQNYVEGNWVIIEGRLSMNRFERPEGFKETRAELVVSHIYRVEGEVVPTVPSSSTGVATSTPQSGTTRKDNVVPMNSYKSKPSELEISEDDFDQPSPPRETKQPPRQPVTQPASSLDDQDLDDIPFVRPVSLKTCESQLQDSWELEANRPGGWLHGVTDLWL